MVKHQLWKVIVAVALAATLVVPGVSATSTVFQSPPPGPPANDDFANATVISGTSFSQSVDVTAATTEEGEPLNNCFYSVQDTVWYQFTAPDNGTVYASLGGTWWGETPLSVYRADGGGFGGLSPSLGCRVQGGFYVSVEAGKTYYFQAGTFGWVSGFLDFSMSFTQAPANDNFANAKVISSLPFNDTVAMAGATTEAYEPQPCDWAPQTVWYSYTPGTNEAVRVTLSGFYDTSLVIYRANGSSITDLIGITCRSWNSPSIEFVASGGTTYYFQVGSIYGTGQTAQLTVETVPPPAHDNFADAKVISSLPFNDNVDTAGATVQTDEPTSPCAWYGLFNTVWYAFTPTTSGSVSAIIPSAVFAPVLAAYTGDSLTSLTHVGCQTFSGNVLRFNVNAGTTYYFQVGKLTSWDPEGSVQFQLEATPQPVADFGYSPYDPNVFDDVAFYNYSWDPANVGISSINWDFGDGKTATEPWNPSHRYTADGDYTVKLTVNTPDGRTASTTRTVPVRTHDVAITKFTVPQSASAGQTRQIVVGLNSRRYVEEVRVELFKSVPNGYEWFGTLFQTVPVRSANRTTDFSFSYTFTKADATIGKVTFKAVATIVNARDALPADNEAISSPTKVAKK